MNPEEPKVVKEVFPNAKVIIDRFHVMQPVIKELNQLRQKAEIKIKGSRFIGWQLHRQ